MSRDFLDTIRNPQGRAAFLRSLEMRAQRMERAPVKFSLERVKPPKKAPDQVVVGMNNQPEGGGEGPAFGDVSMEWIVSVVSGIALTAEDDLEFTMNEKTYHYVEGAWEGDSTPASDPPEGYVGSDSSTTEEKGGAVWMFLEVGSFVSVQARLVTDENPLPHWEVKKDSREDLEAFLETSGQTPLVIDHGTWDLAGSNGSETPYNGRSIGVTSNYTVGEDQFYIDDVVSRTSAYIYPIDIETLYGPTVYVGE